MVVVPQPENQENMPSRINMNGIPTTQARTESMRPDSQMSQLDQLLEQVKSLKQENSTLKNELSNNTSQISRLESEASNLKEMVMKLGNSINAPTSLETDTPSESRHHSSAYKDAANMESTFAAAAPAHSNIFAPPAFNNQNLYKFQTLGYSAYNQVNFVSLEIQKRMLLNKRDNLLHSLHREEYAKDCYMRKLEDLNNNLQKLQESDKSFSPAGENAQQQLEQEIFEIKEAMEKSLGTPEIMDQRGKELVYQLRLVEQELLQQHPVLVDRQIRLPVEVAQMTTEPKQKDYGTYERSEAVTTKRRGFFDAAVQTGKSTEQFSILSEDLLSPVQSVPLNLTSGTRALDRCTQTTLTCVIATNSPLSRDRAGSATSLPENLTAGDVQLAEVRKSQLAGSLELVRGHCKMLSQLLRRHAELVNRNKPDKADKSGANELAAVQSLQANVQVSALLQRCVEQVNQLSFNQADRSIINYLGGISTLADLLILDHRANQETNAYQQNSTDCLVKPAGFTITNLSFGHKNNKTLLVKKSGFLETVVDQLKNKSEEIQKAMASILRNLSWQADEESRDLLREKGAVRALTLSVMSARREETLKSMLGALWNLSGHCPENRSEICAIEGSLAFFVSTLSFRSPSNHLGVVESGGGVLRNVSSVVAVNDEYRKILRQHNCLHLLIKLLSSPSLTIVSNACSTLWNLSARDSGDQQLLRELGAVSRLNKLRQSKHKVIAQGSGGALRNLLQNQPDKVVAACAFGVGDGKSDMPILQARKLRQLESELKLGAPKASTDMGDNFSPRHLAQVPGYQQQQQQKNSHFPPQRNSMQERTSQSPKPQPNVAPAAIHRSGSGAILTFQDGPGPSYPIHAWGANQQNPSTKFSFENQGFDAMTRNTLPHTSDPAITRHLYPHAAGIPQSGSLSRAAAGASSMMPSRTWGQGSLPEPKWSPPTGTEAHSAGEVSLLSPSKMPVNLEEKLRRLDNLEEDNEVPVDYSKFTDELSRTPAIQGPRAEEAFDRQRFPKSSSQQSKSSTSATASTSISAQPTVTTASRSPVATGNKQQQQTPSTAAKVGFSVQQQMLYDNNDMYEPEETPTNFSAIYTEEPLYHHLQNESYGQQMYAAASEAPDRDGQEWMKTYNVEDTPICFASHSPLSNLNGDGNEPEHEQPTLDQQKSSVEFKEQRYADPNEEEDKFEPNSGINTPGQYVFSDTPIYQETPLIFSRNSPASSLSDIDPPSPHFEVASDPGSRLVSGWASPSDLPDSPGQSMPVSRNRSLTNIHEASTAKAALEPNSNSQSRQIVRPTPTLPKTNAQNAAGSGADLPKPIPGYVTTLPASDEITKYAEEPAMSEMTAFSGLTIDDHKVAPVGNVKTLPKIQDEKEEPASTTASSSDAAPKDASTPQDLADAGSRAIIQAGYYTSLPTNDEIKLFTNEDGTLSPMTAFSEISALKQHNDGFQRKGKNSFASRSSATGASFSALSSSGVKRQEPEASSVGAGASGVVGKDAAASKSVSDLSSDHNDAKDVQDDLDDDLDSLDDSSSDDEASAMMLQQCISLGKHSNKSRSSKSGKSGSSRGKDRYHSSKKSSSSAPKVPPKPQPPPAKPEPVQTPAPAPMPVPALRKFNVKEKLAAADQRLNGLSMKDYIANKMGDERDNLPENRPSAPADSKSLRPDESSQIADRERSLPGRQVIKTVETLNESYSVKKHLRSNERQTPDSQEPQAVASHPQVQAVSNQAKVQAFLQSAPNVYAVEGTPIEMSRCTSLSNLTVDSGPDNSDFSALQRKIADRSVKGPDKAQASVSSTNQSSNVVQGSIKEDPVTVNVIEASPPANRQPENTDESQTILDNLDRQIQNLTISTVTSPTGYVTSLPHGDEITKFHVEGSVGAHTNFSALTIDSSTKIKPLGQVGCHPVVEVVEAEPPPVVVKEPHTSVQFQSDRDDCQGIPDPARHYGEDRTPSRDRPLSYKIEDTPLCLSGNNSSLSSIDIESDSDANLLKDCISSAMPVARRDPAAALPPSQLALYQQQQQQSYARHPTNHQHAIPTSQYNHHQQQQQVLNPWDSAHPGPSQLPKESQLNAISPMSLVSLSSPDMPSTGFTVSSATNNTQTSEGYYRLSRQPSISESLNSEGSVALGGDAASLMKSKNPRPKIVKKKAPQSEGSSDAKTPVVKGGRKIYRSPITGKPRENLRGASHSRDTHSSESSDTRKFASSARNRNNKSPCVKCHQSRARQLPQSSSMGKLVDSPPGRVHRKAAASAYSKPMARDCVHDLRKPSRSRSAHSGVTQLYPSVKGMNSVMHGVVSMAARGDLVLAQYDGQTAQMVPIPVSTAYGVQGARPVFIKQGTFIQDEPSPALLESVARQQQQQQIQQSRQRKVQGKQAKKGGEGAKGSTVWKGLKKLLSPSEESKTLQPTTPKSKKKSQAATTTPKKGGAAKGSVDGSDTQSYDSSTWTKSRNRRDPKTPVVSRGEPPKSKSADAIRQQTSNLSLSSSSPASSLSLSSSSSNASAGGAPVDQYKAQTPKKNIYLTERSMNPAKHVPKSPSPRNRIIVGKSPPTKPRTAAHARNRTPTPEYKAKAIGARKTSMESSSSAATSASLDCRRSSKTASLSSKSRLGSQASVSAATDRSGPRAKASPGQSQEHSRPMLVEEIVNAARPNPAEGHSRSTHHHIQRVVQEVAPFNYRPYPHYYDQFRGDPGAEGYRPQLVISEDARSYPMYSEDSRTYPVIAEVYRSEGSSCKQDPEIKQTAV